MSSRVSRRSRSLALSMSAVFFIASCGGGGGDAPPAATPTPTPPTQAGPSTVSGVVLVAPPGPASSASQPAAAITVCFDANINGVCDAAEPSTAADSGGQYTLTGLPTAQPVGAPVLAVVNISGAVPYTLRAPVERASLVSAITTLVQAGVAQGLNLAASEAATARQLQLSVSGLSQNYVQPSTADAEALLTVDWAIVGSLRDGIPLSVGISTADDPDVSLSRLAFTSAKTYDARFYQYTDSYDAQSGSARFYVLTAAVSGGVQRSTFAPLSPSWNEGPNGWVPAATEANANLTTRGNPNVVLWSNGARNAIIRTEIDVSGQSIASVVQQVQSTALNSPVATISGLPANLAGIMPAGAKLRREKWTARFVDNYLESASVLQDSLSTLISLYPNPTSPTAANTLSLGAAFTTTGTCINNVCPGSNMRASFDAATQSARYYRCDASTTQTNVSNCQTISTGSYTVGTSNDGVTPQMRFTAPNGLFNPVHGLVERNGKIYLINGLAYKFGSGSAMRMNRVAYNALAAALGISSAPTLTTVSPFIGIWQASYTGSETGDCPWMLIDALGNFGGQCTSATRGFTLFGKVSDQGDINATATSSDQFSGKFAGSSASGVWNQPSSSAGGSWSANARH